MPYLNVDNDNLVYIKYVSYKKDWPKLKRDINSKIGGQLKFIETFEAWFRRRIGHIVLEFDTRESLVEFVYLLNVGKFLDDQVFYQVLYEDSRKEFFDMIRKNTGVDLIECRGAPPSAQKRHHSWASDTRSSMSISSSSDRDRSRDNDDRNRDSQKIRRD